ncbi:MAG: DUF4114 domain-containing protein [Synechocystis sp.]
MVGTASITVNVTNSDEDITESATKFDDPENDGLGSLTYDFSGTTGNVFSQADEAALKQTNALFHNIVGLYQVVNTSGAVQATTDINGDGLVDGNDLLNPGDAGYAAAALNSKVDNFSLQLGAEGDAVKNTDAAEFGDVLLQGGLIYSPFVIANGGNLIPTNGTIAQGVDAFLAKNPTNTGATIENFLTHEVAYFSFAGANPDGSSHLKNLGNNTFGFEDLPGNIGVSDFDFNDGVFKFNFIG